MHSFADAHAGVEREGRWPHLLNIGTDDGELGHEPQ